MKYFLTAILILSFVVMATFGLAFFNHGMDSSSGDCAVSAVDGTACPANIVDMMLHHISVIQTLTVSTVPSSVHRFLLLASMLLIAALLFLFYDRVKLSKLESLPGRLRDLTLDSLRRQQKIISWLSLLEFSPALQ